MYVVSPDAWGWPGTFHKVGFDAAGSLRALDAGQLDSLVNRTILGSASNLLLKDADIVVSKCRITLPDCIPVALPTFMPSIQALDDSSEQRGNDT